MLRILSKEKDFTASCSQRSQAAGGVGGPSHTTNLSDLTPTLKVKVQLTQRKDSGTSVFGLNQRCKRH